MSVNKTTTTVYILRLYPVYNAELKIVVDCEREIHAVVCMNCEYLKSEYNNMTK